MILDFILVFGGIWLLLTLFEPIVSWMDAGSACDHKYAFDRWYRDRRYKEIEEQHILDPPEVPVKAPSKRQLKREAKEQRRAMKREARKLTKKKRKELKCGNGKA